MIIETGLETCLETCLDGSEACGWSELIVLKKTLSITSPCRCAAGKKLVFVYTAWGKHYRPCIFI